MGVFVALWWILVLFMFLAPIFFFMNPSLLLIVKVLAALEIFKISYMVTRNKLAAILFGSIISYYLVLKYPILGVWGWWIMLLMSMHFLGSLGWFVLTLGSFKGHSREEAIRKMAMERIEQRAMMQRMGMR